MTDISPATMTVVPLERYELDNLTERVPDVRALTQKNYLRLLATARAGLADSAGVQSLAILRSQVAVMVDAGATTKAAWVKVSIPVLQELLADSERLDRLNAAPFSVVAMPGIGETDGWEVTATSRREYGFDAQDR